MATIKSTLDDIWRIFKDVRILDDSRIIQSIAAILSRNSKRVAGLGQLMPRIPTEVPLLVQSDVPRAIRHAATNNQTDIATIFDRHVLFRLREMLPGNRYPTPRHLVGFLYRIADVQPHMSLLDPACGTGGFLVHHIRESQGAGTCVGIEIDREWVGLAAVNLALHHVDFAGNTPPELHASNALSTSSPVVTQFFDRVLLNPPFEEDLQTSFLRRGLELLKPEGHMCLLVSAGTLFSTTEKAKEIRRTLVDGGTGTNHRLRAVLELPPNVSQPYSGIRTFALLIEPGGSSNQARQHALLETAGSQEQAETQPAAQLALAGDQAAQPQAPWTTWFLRAKSDGYSAVRARDLTVDPPNLGDLTLIEELLRDQRTGAGPARAYRVLTADTGKQIVRAVLHRAQQSDQHYIEMVQQDVGANAGPQTSWFNLSDLTRLNAAVEKLDPELEYLREPDPPVQQLAVTPDGRLLGVSVDIKSLQSDPYDLQVDRFLRERAQERKDDPLEVAARLHDRERSLLAIIGELRELVEDRRERPATLPPSVDQNSLTQQPVGRLSKEQQRVWVLVQGLRAVVDGKVQIHYFDANDVIALLKRKASDAAIAPIVVESTLIILEQMGLITAVQIHTDDNQSYAAYRLCTHYDAWEYTPPQNEQPETSAQ